MHIIKYLKLTNLIKITALGVVGLFIEINQLIYNKVYVTL